MPRGPDDDPVFEKVRSWALPDVAAWGVDGGHYSDDGRYRWAFRRPAAGRRWQPRMALRLSPAVRDGHVRAVE